MRLFPLRRLLAAAPLLFIACTTTPPPEPSAAPQPFAPSGPAKRVVMLSLDGLGADALADQQGLRTFDWLKSAGTAARIVTINPTQTAPAHATILTGALPDKHGIVANRFHLAGTPFTETAHGLNADLAVETLVEAARRQGKRVGSIAFPTVDSRNPRRTADFGLLWSIPFLPARTVTLERRNFGAEWVPPTWKSREQPHPSFSPVMHARVDCGGGLKPVLDVQLSVYDTTDDQRENYDSLIIEAGGKEVPIDGRGWFALTRREGQELQGSWSRIVEVKPDLSGATIYCGGWSTTSAYPDQFRAIVEEVAGFWPGEPDARAGAEVYREQIARLSTFLTAVQTAAIRRMPFDLLLAYQPQIDESSHDYLIVNPSQKPYSVDNGAAAATVRRTAFEFADRAANSIAAALDLTSDAFVVMGDHGLVAIDTEVRVNRLLAENGFSDDWRAFGSGNVANFYRLDGHPVDAPRLVDVLQKSGFFEQVRTKTAASHANSGEVTAITYPHFVVNPSAEPPLTGPSKENGSHGALNSHRELHTVFFAVGAGVPRREHAEVPQTRIARFVATLLGISPPSAAE